MIARLLIARRSPSAAALLCAGLLVLGASGARAGDCNADIGALSQTRQASIDKLNILAKAAKGKLDPIASCPVLQNLVKAEGALVKYLVANDKWCNVPEETVTLKASAAKSVGFATQACTIAAQAKKQQQQQASGGGLQAPEAQKLPTGPL